MTKPEFVAAVAENAGTSKADAERVVSAALDTISGALSKGESVQFVGFGTFEVRNRAARMGVNPKTGEKLQIKASKAPAFKAGKKLKDAVA